MQLKRLRGHCEAKGYSNEASVLHPCWKCGALATGARGAPAVLLGPWPSQLVPRPRPSPRRAVSASECAVCHTKVHVCCASHHILGSGNFTWCPLCMCLFSPDVAPASSRCRVCTNGLVIAATDSDVSNFTAASPAGAPEAHDGAG